MLVKCWGVGEGASQHPQWLVDAVYVSEPDVDADGSERLSTPDWDEECVVTPLPPGEAEDLFADVARGVWERLRSGELALESADHARNYLLRAVHTHAAHHLRALPER